MRTGFQKVGGHRLMLYASTEAKPSISARRFAPLRPADIDLHECVGSVRFHPASAGSAFPARTR